MPPSCRRAFASLHVPPTTLLYPTSLLYKEEPPPPSLARHRLSQAPPTWIGAQTEDLPAQGPNGVSW